MELMYGKAGAYENVVRLTYNGVTEGELEELKNNKKVFAIEKQNNKYFAYIEAQVRTMFDVEDIQTEFEDAIDVIAINEYPESRCSLFDKAGIKISSIKGV